MDIFDRKLLEAVQRDDSRTNEQLAELVGISPSSIQRRLKHLEKTGVILGRTVVVHPGKAGQHMTFIVGIEIEQKRPDLYENLRHWLASADGVQQAYNVTGASDFMIIATAPTLDDFDSLMNRMMAENPNIRKYITSVVLQTYKRTLFVPTIMNDRLV